jgi:hypothetical protein
LRYLNFIILSCFICVLNANAQQIVGLNHSLHPLKNSEEAIYNLQYQWNDSGYFDVKIFYSDQHLLMTGRSLDSLGQQLNGYSKWYYKNGNLQAEGNYKSAQKQGTWKRYNEDGSKKSDRHYSDVSMNNIVFNSALYMPKPIGVDQNFEDFVKAKVIEEQAMDIVSLSPVAIQMLIANDGSLREIKYDDRLSIQEMTVLDEIIKQIPSWSPGSNGSQNLNVQVNYLLKF